MNRNITRPSFYNKPAFHHDDYMDGEMIYVTNAGTGRVEARRTIERRSYVNAVPTVPQGDDE